MPTDVEIVDSSTATPEFTEVSLDSLTSEQDKHWRLTGELPQAKPADAPPAIKTNEAPPEGGEPKGKQEAGKGKGVKPRIEEVDAEIQDLRTKLAVRAELKKQLDETSDKKTDSQPATPAELKAPVRPKAAEFNGTTAWEDLEEAKLKYAEDMADYKAALAVQNYKAQAAEERTKEKQQTEGQNAADNWNKQIEEAAKAHADWNEIVDPVSDLVGKDKRFISGASFLLESPAGAEVLYQLGRDPERAEAIAAMSPIEQVAALAVMAHELKKPVAAKAPPTPKKQTEVPPPPTELNGRNIAPVDPVAAALESGDTEAYIKAANARDAAAKRRVYQR